MEEKHNLNFTVKNTYSHIYNTIKNEIKDFVINRLLNQIYIQNEQLEIIKIENEILKKNLTYIIKKGLLEHYNQKNISKYNKYNFNTINSKSSLNNSFFFTPKITENNNYIHTELNSLNESQIFRNKSIDKKTNDFMYYIFKKNAYKNKFLLTRNISLYEGINGKEKYKKNLNHSCDNFIFTDSSMKNYNLNKNKYLNNYHSQKDISSNKLIPKSSLDKLLRNSSNDNSYRLTLSNEKKKNLKKQILIRKEILNLKKKQDNRKIKNRSPFLKNKI